MAINGVLRPGQVAIRVSEMDAAVRHYTEVLGLIETARDAQGRVFLKAWDEHDHGRRLARRGAELPPACMSDGDDPRHAIDNVMDAIACWIAAAKADGRPVPRPAADAAA
jgi:catechol 2,3-dioxygenase